MKKETKKIAPRKCISWDECFMRMAHVIAERSKDPSTQAGAVITTQNNVVIGMGYNGFPRGIDNDKLPWEREGGFFPKLNSLSDKAKSSIRTNLKSFLLLSILLL